MGLWDGVTDGSVGLGRDAGATPVGCCSPPHLCGMLLPILPLPLGSHEHRLLLQLCGETQKEQLHGPWSPPSSWRGCGRI